jgi:hypothetical protein
MTHSFSAGTLFMHEGAELPNSHLLQRDSNANGWSTVTNARSTFEKELPDAGWTFFFMAGEIKTTVFGFDREKALRTALRRLIADAKTQKCNGLEITHVTDKSFLKMPYVTVSAHPRHLQKGATFSGSDSFKLNSR